ncbi:type I-E CRISPR-associated protein Cas7/Cse4/CasC [Pseudactinotalea terrae]|uniref:type I-E CRISPR-associated protein Cas7/Cse4/CasC n=1 Tax=Pseudactinotalea terrae TaxID=1743262 RepID=UPI001391D305|nr:type I-E CRISPR-associated protein Cas7/Cse4/CasC [Pseudactinotalea terrae]
MTNLFLDLHLIQTVPPSCVNRDDTGAPKKAVYGGVQRHRVSSQAWKYVARRYLHEVASVDLATRSRRHPVALVRLAQEADPTVDAAAAAVAAAEVVKSLTSPKSGTLKVKDADLAAALEQVETEEAEDTAAEGAEDEEGREAKAVVVSLSGAERRALAAVVLEVARKITAGGKVDRAKDINAPATAALVGAAQAADQHLFGRFIAGTPEAKVEAAVHVAHALSTHAAYSEDDAYTAVGDPEPGDNIQRGADFLDVAEFVSSTLYRYVRLDLGDLLEQYGPEEVAELTGQVAEAFALSMPGGKGAGFAPDSVPAVVTAVLRSDRPVSAAQAFEAPVRSAEGYESASVQRLASFLANVDASGMVAAPLAVATASIAHDPIGDRLAGRLSASVADLVRPALAA